MDDYTRQILRVVVAQICQTIGWHAIQSTPLELLTDILHKYVQELSRQTHRYTELYGRTDANLDDVGLALNDLNINIPDLLEYINNVDSVQCAIEVPKYPIHKDSNLNFLKPGSKEVITRPVHVHEHLPAIYPEKEVDDVDPGQPGQQLCAGAINPGIDLIAIPPDLLSNCAANENGLFKKPEITEIPIIKKPRILHEEEGRPTREISSVMMTSSGFISPAREGKLPDSKTPILPEYKPIVNRPPPSPPLPVSETRLIELPPDMGCLESAERHEKKVRKQRSVKATSTLEAKEQRKRERQLAKLKKQNAGGSVATATTTKSSSASGRKQKMRQNKMKYSNLDVVRSTTVDETSSLLPISVPADLTIKSEPHPILPYDNLSSLTNSASAAASRSASIAPDFDKKPNADEIKLSCEPDKQKYNIFKKISTKKGRDDTHHHHHHHHHHRKSPGIPPHLSLYSGFPPLPESTTIRAIPPVKADSHLNSDSSIIVVDDDSPPGRSELRPSPSCTQLLPIPPLVMPPTPHHSQQHHIDRSLAAPPPPFLHMPPMKAPRKPRRTKQQIQQQRMLLEQSAPLNLSSETIPSQPPFFNMSPTKQQRKTKTKTGRINKRNTSQVITLDAVRSSVEEVRRSMADNIKRDEASMNILKETPFLSGMSGYPGMMLYQFPMIPRPGLIPTNNPLIPLNPFAYSDFLALRPQLRPAKLQDNPPITPPLDMENCNVYCNVAPLVPDSLKLLPPASSFLPKENKPSTSGGLFSSLNQSSTTTSGLLDNNVINPYNQQPSVSMSSNRSPKILDVPIVISDDEKLKSDTEPDKIDDSSITTANMKNSPATSSGNFRHSPNKSANSSSSTSQRTLDDSSKMIIDDDYDNMIGDSDRDEEFRAVDDDDDDDQAPLIASTSGRSEKKRDKEHKKGKRGKDGKIKKKKDKKDKSKSKEKAEKRKEEKKEKDRNKKLKKQKRREKMRAMSYNSDDTKPTTADNLNQDQHLSSSSIPKLTLKLSSPRSSGAGGDDDSLDGRKIARVMLLRGNNGGDDYDDESIDDIVTNERRESSPELARISPLVTRPPKQKSSTKDKSSDNEQSPGNVASTSGSSSVAAASSTVVVAPPPPLHRGPGRPPKNPNAALIAAQAAAAAAAAAAAVAAASSNYHSISSNTVSSTTSFGGGGSTTIYGRGHASGSGSIATATVSSSTSASSSMSMMQAVDSTDAEGNQVWICPACGRVDDGTPMIGCDGCDAWYHWVCVGIQVPPDEREDWYCRVCIAKKQEANGSDKKKKRKKKNKAN